METMNMQERQKTPEIQIDSDVNDCFYYTAMNPVWIDFSYLVYISNWMFFRLYNLAYHDFH